MSQREQSPDERIGDKRRQFDLHCRRASRLLGQLEPSERALWDDFVSDMRATPLAIGEAPSTLRRLMAEDYEREPVSVERFVYDDFYLGRVLRGAVFDVLVKDVALLFDGNYTEVIMGGGIGYGKTRFMEISVAYDLYRVTCLRDPAHTFGMIPGSNITFVNISVTKAQATKVFFQDLYTLLQGSPYFNKVATFNQKLKNEMRFDDKQIRVYPVAASEQAALGTGVFAACLDEGNFMQIVERSRRSTPGEEGTYDQAEAVYNKLSARIRSRMTQRGRVPGHIYVASSARYPDDFVERLFKRAEEESEEGIYEMFTRRYATWETRPPGKFCRQTFKVEIGDLTRCSRVLTGTETNVMGRVIDVPMDFYRDFEQDTDRAVRDLAGISVMSIRPFISERYKIARMFELGVAQGIKHPFTGQSVTLQEKDPELEKLIPSNLHWVERQHTDPVTGIPLLENGQPATERVLCPALYNAHLDLSKRGDATGLVIAHNIGARKVQRMHPQTTDMVEEKKPIIRVDLVLRIVAPKHGEIDIPRIRALFYELNRVHKMQFGRITFDTFGSQEAIKTLKDEGFNADVLSVDRDMAVYETLRTAIYDERVVCYMNDQNGKPVNEVLQRELVQLERGEKKIDHAATHGGSKDMADALAGAVFNCEEMWRAGEHNGIFAFGIVETVGAPTQSGLDRIAEINRKVAAGIPITEQDENDILFTGLLGEL